MKYYVYALFDPRSNLPFYIGKGQGKRMYDHLKETTGGIRKHNRIQEIRDQGFEPIPKKLISHLTEQEALDKEVDLIKLYGREGIDDGGILTNNCLHTKGIVMTAEVCDKISKSRQGIQFSESTKRKMSEAKKGKTWEDIFGIEKAAEMRVQRAAPRGPLGEATKEKISKANSGVVRHAWSEESRKKLSETNKGKKPHINTIEAAKANASKIVQCPHCNKQGKGLSMRRWHMDNCKDKP